MTAAIEAFAASDRTRRLVWCLCGSTRVSDEHLLPCPQCGVTQQHGTSTMKQPSGFGCGLFGGTTSRTGRIWGL